jgi:serine/threonine protein kinase
LSVNFDQFRSDVWSFGIVLWEVFSRDKTPYANIKSTLDLESFLNQGNRLSHPGPGCPEELYEIMQTCWVADPAKRPTFSQLYTTMQQVINELESDVDVDYSNVYLTVSPFRVYKL